MRLVLLGLCLLLAAPAGAQTPMGVQPGRAGEDRVVVAIFGGLLGRAIRENVALWARPLGVQTVFVEGSSGDLLAKLRAQRGAPQFDVALLNDQSFVIARNMGLIDKPDPAVVTNLATLRAGFGRADGFGVPYEVNPGRLGLPARQADGGRGAAAGALAGRAGPAPGRPGADLPAVADLRAVAGRGHGAVGRGARCGRTIRRTGRSWTR